METGEKSLPKCSFVYM